MDESLQDLPAARHYVRRPEFSGSLELSGPPLGCGYYVMYLRKSDVRLGRRLVSMSGGLLGGRCSGRGACRGWRGAGGCGVLCGRGRRWRLRLRSHSGEPVRAGRVAGVPDGVIMPDAGGDAGRAEGQMERRRHAVVSRSLLPRMALVIRFAHASRPRALTSHVSAPFPRLANRMAAAGRRLSRAISKC